MQYKNNYLQLDLGSRFKWSFHHKDLFESKNPDYMRNKCCHKAIAANATPAPPRTNCWPPVTRRTPAALNLVTVGTDETPVDPVVVIDDNAVVAPVTVVVTCAVSAEAEAPVVGQPVNKTG